MRAKTLLLWLAVSSVPAIGCGTSDDPFSDAGGTGGGGSGGNGGEPGGAGGQDPVGPASSSTASGPGGCPGLGDACTDCEAVECQEEYCACYGNTSCVNMAACGAACAPNDLGCFQECWTANPAGISDGALLVDCAATKCPRGCPGLTPLTPCQKCLYEGCPAQMNVCIANPACVDLLYCLAACTDAACPDACYAEHPDGVVDAGPVGQCAQASCAAICG